MDELRRVCAEIASRARSVRIEHAALTAYARALSPAPLTAAPGRAPAGGTPEELARVSLSLDAINFGSGWFPTLRKSGSPPRSGYGTISAAWRAHCESRGAPTPAQLVAMSPAAIAEILGQDPQHELMELFALSLRDLGDRLREECEGQVLALIQDAQGSAVAFAEHLGGWPSFADRSRYEELSVPFLKRAQIAAADLQRAGAARWRDTDRLTMFADNLVPHVLRLDGVLLFEEDLVQRIERGELIEHGSAEEVEIRACAVHAVELIVAARADGSCAAEIDELLWNRGQAPAYKSRPRHRSRCTAY